MESEIIIFLNKKNRDSSFVSPITGIFWWKTNGSILKTMPTLHDQSRAHVFLTRIVRTWRHSDIIYDRSIKTSKNSSGRNEQNGQGRVCKIWWWYLLSFVSYQKTSQGWFAPSPERGAGKNCVRDRVSRKYLFLTAIEKAWSHSNVWRTYHGHIFPSVALCENAKREMIQKFWR